MPKTMQYFTLDFYDLTEQGLRKLIRAFRSEGQNTTEFQEPSRAVRQDGQRIKAFKLFFDSGQSITVTVNETGDIVKTKLNSTVIPVDGKRSERDYAKDVANKIQRNQESFEKSLARKAARAIKNESNNRKASKTLMRRIEEAQEAHAAAKESLAAIDTSLDEINKQLSEVRNATDKDRGLFSSEKDRTNDLLEQLEKLGEIENG
ncbi:hypothetical protein MHM93_14665 [Pseudoalteromonas sp. MM17-2]|uniref:defense against restriction DarA-related protein n=1 Tax=Pseudoalteromonas sp. MM17-2 TaxID=2917753 RepID=UPI001EF6E2A4|nr:hypothetical protein [Pseudoalteromonas sp. MM17-2]MCG7545421.1 hypothetical protein [Pseudoalteromonas sp. MM17-2]